MKNNTSITDVISGTSYKFKENTLSLILFIDAASYNKSGNKSIWAIFSTIAELPPQLRHSYENVIFHSLLSGGNPDFNNYLETYNSEINDLIENGFKHNNITYNIRVFLFLADAPARAKVCKINQFNGKYGCIKCLHPSEYLKEKKKTVYPVDFTIEKRTNKSYEECVQEAIESRTTIKGVKGFAYISNWISIPNNILLDYMHLCLQGTFNSMFNNFFDSQFHLKEFYLGELVF